MRTFIAQKWNGEWAVVERETCDTGVVDVHWCGEIGRRVAERLAARMTRAATRQTQRRTPRRHHQREGASA